MRIDALEPGQRFALAGIPSRRGVLLGLSPSCATVRYDGRQDVAAGEAHFTRPYAPVTVSLGTPITLLPEDVCATP